MNVVRSRAYTKNSLVLSHFVDFFFQDFEKSEDILTLGCAARAGEELLDPADLEDDENLVYVSGSSSGGKASVKHYPFDYCWDKAQQSKAHPVPIPGTTKSKFT